MHFHECLSLIYYTGTSWTAPWLGSVTGETYIPEWCTVQNATPIIGWYSVKSLFPSSLLPRGKVPRRRNFKRTNFMTQKWKTISKSYLRENKTSLCGSCRAWGTVERDEDHTTWKHGWSCWSVDQTTPRVVWWGGLDNPKSARKETLLPQSSACKTWWWSCVRYTPG